MADLRDPHRPRNLTTDEEQLLNDIGHELGCFCRDCRPDYHDPRDPLSVAPMTRGPRAA